MPCLERQENGAFIRAIKPQAIFRMRFGVITGNPPYQMKLQIFRKIRSDGADKMTMPVIPRKPFGLPANFHVRAKCHADDIVLYEKEVFLAPAKQKSYVMALVLDRII